MADSQQSTADLLALFPDNTAKSITAQASRELALSMVNFRGAYAAAESYYPGNQSIGSDGILYQFIGATPAAGDNPVGSTTGNWYGLAKSGGTTTTTPGTTNTSSGATVLATAVLDFDASQLNVADESNLTLWPDLSGNKNNATYGGTTSAVVHNDTVNGLAAVAMNGPFITTNAQAVQTVFVVAQNANAAFAQYDGLFDVSGGGDPFLVGEEGTARWRNEGMTGVWSCDGVDGVGDDADSDIPNLTAWHLYTFEQAEEASTATWCFGRYESYSWSGYIAQVVAFAGTLSAKDKASVTSSLMSKWGIATPS